MRLQKILSNRNINMFAFLVFGIYLIYRVVLIFYPHPDAGGVENNVIWFIQRLLDGHHLYTDPESSPYSIAQYSPLYYYITVGIGKIAGISPDDVLSVFRLSRTVSLIFNLAYIGVIILIVKNVFSASLLKGFLAAVFAFIFLEITSYSRPDSLELLLFFLSIYCTGRWLNKKESGEKSGGFFIWSIVFAVLALFSKQSSVMLPLIMLVWLIRKKWFKESGVYLLLYFSLLAAGLFLVHYESGLKALYQNTILGINNGVSPYWFFNHIVTDFYQEFGLLWVPVLVMVLLLLKKERNDRYLFLSIALLLIFISSNLFAVKWGSSPGYFTEWCGLVFIGIAVLDNSVMAAVKLIHPQFGSFVIAFVLIVKMSLIVYPMLEKVRPEGRRQMWAGYKMEQELAGLIKTKLGNDSGHKVFNNLYSPASWLNNLLFRQTVLPQYEVVIFGTWKRKVFDYDRFRKEMQDGTVQYILGGPTGEPLLFSELHFTKFMLQDSLYGYRIYHYNP